MTAKRRKPADLKGRTIRHYCDHTVTRKGKKVEVQGEWPGAAGADVERFNSHTMTRHDLFGIFDVMICAPGLGFPETASLRWSAFPWTAGGGKIVGVQVCARSTHAAHLKKMKEAPLLRVWQECGGLALLVSWVRQRQRKKDGTLGKAIRWEAKEEWL